MTIIKEEKSPNGARANQTIRGVLRNIPKGWLAVPEELEEVAHRYLPWLDIEVKDGKLTGVSEDAESRAAFEAEMAKIKEENVEAEQNGN